MKQESLDKIVADSQTILENCRRLQKEMDAMNEDKEFLLNEYKTNKHWFRTEPGRVTTEDIIKSVYEFAWTSSRNYFMDEQNKPMCKPLTQHQIIQKQNK